MLRPESPFFLRLYLFTLTQCCCHYNRLAQLSRCRKLVITHRAPHEIIPPLLLDIARRDWLYAATHSGNHTIQD